MAPDLRRVSSAAAVASLCAARATALKTVSISGLDPINSFPAGQAAAKEHLGVSLGEILTEFLGPGKWEPL